MERFRVTDKLTPLTETVSSRNTSCVTSEQILGTDGVVGSKNETWDVVSPRYFSRRRKGEIIINPYTNRKVTYFNSVNGISYESVGGEPCKQLTTNNGPRLTRLLKRLPPIDVIPHDEKARAIDLAVTKAFGNVNASEAEIFVFLAELTRTYRLLRQPYDNLLTMFKKIMRDKRRHPDRRKRALTLLQYLSREWLKYRYGVMPLLFEIQGVQKALEADLERKLHTARGRHVIETEKTFPVSQRTWGNFTTHWQDTSIHQFEVKAGILFRLNVTTPDLLGMNLRSVPSAVWEVIPFSFVVDWFFNVQSFIQAYSPTPGVDVLGKYLVTTDMVNTTRVVLGTTNNSPETVNLLRQDTGQEHVVSRVKTRVTELPRPSLTRKINLGRFAPDQRVLDTIALVVTILSKR